MLECIKFIHRWLGLLSGLVVFIVSTTGAFLVFEEDIALWGKPHALVEPMPGPFLPPDTLLHAAEVTAPPKMSPTGIWYGTANRSAIVKFSDRQNHTLADVYVNPYDATVMAIDEQHEDDHHEGFFHFMEEGHIHLWLPEDIGRLIVGYSTIAFVIILVTGLIWWYPAKWNKGTIKKSFLIKWNARFKRLTIDLHNVPGFYVLLLALALAITGLYFSFGWVGKLTYWFASGGEAPVAVQFPISDTTHHVLETRNGVLGDIWKRHHTTQQPPWKQLFISIPSTPTATWLVAENPHKTSSHTVNLHFYDRYTGAELFKRNRETGEILQRDIAYRSMLYHYNIHLGRIGGKATQWIALVVCLVCASLPITGFLIWYNRKLPLFSKNPKKNTRSRRFPVDRSKTTENP